MLRIERFYIGRFYDRAGMGESELGAIVRRRRLSLGMTQEQLAETAGTDQAYVSQIERGKVQRPRDELVRALALALELDVDELMIAMGYVIRPWEGESVGLPSEAQSRSHSAVSEHVRLVADNSDILTDEDWQEIEAVIERRRREGKRV